MENFVERILYEHQALINKLDELQHLGKIYLEYLEDTSKNEMTYAKKLYMQSINQVKSGKTEVVTELMESSMATVFKQLNKQGQNESEVHRITSERLTAIQIDFE